MAIQLLAGIPWLAGIIGSIFVGLFSWFMQYMTRRLAVVAAAIALITGLTVGLFTALDVLLSVLVLSVPPDVLTAAGIFLPTNIPVCVSIIVSAHMLKFAYDWNIKVIQYRLF